MDINSIIKEVQNTNWQKSDDFKIIITTSNEKLSVQKVLGVKDVDALWAKSVISFETPTISAPASEHYLGGEWRIQTGRPEVFKFGMKFRDFDSGDLRRYFATLFTYNQYNYVEDSYIQIKVTNTADDIVIFKSDEVLIENVSAGNFDSQNSSISEFSVQFTSPTYTDDFLERMGSKEYIEKFQEDPALAAKRQEIIDAVGEWKI